MKFITTLILLKRAVQTKRGGTNLTMGYEIIISILVHCAYAERV